MDLLRIEDLHVEVAGKEVLKGVDLSIPQGELHALFGPNGSGKSTLIKAVMGFSDYRITRGTVLFKDREVNELSIDQRAKMGIGIALQHPPSLSGITLEKLMEITSNGDMDEELVKKMKLERFLEREANVGFSGGEAKRAELAQMVSMKPQLTLLDEPESGVDVENVYLVAKAIECILGRGGVCEKMPIKDRKRSALMITHTGEVLRFLNADKGHVMVDGVIGCSGNPMEILERVRDVGYEECVICPTCK